MFDNFKTDFSLGAAANIAVGVIVAAVLVIGTHLAYNYFKATKTAA